MARIEFGEKLFFDLNLKARVKNGFVVKKNSIILEELKKSTVEIAIDAQFDDIDISSVRIEPAYGYVKVSNIRTTENGVVFSLVEGDAAVANSTTEILDVQYCLRETKSIVKNQRIDLAIKSNAIFARPRMIRAVVSKNDDGIVDPTVRLEMNLHNVSPEIMPKVGDTIAVEIGTNSLKYEAVVFSIEQQGAISFASCRLDVKMPAEVSSGFSKSRDWLALTLISDSFRVDGLKCVFVSGE